MALPPTEQDSQYDELEKKTVRELLESMNALDRAVPERVAEALPQIEALTEAVVAKLQAGGRLFYLGSGTSGRLGVVDASECPPTFGVAPGLVVGLIAGGDAAIRQAQEFAEDDAERGFADLQARDVSPADFVVGLSASGATPYVLGALRRCREAGIATGGVTCNPDTPLAAAADFPVEVITGPEFVTGSTRLKAGTAQKLVLNMLTTATMIRLGRVRGNKMADMQLANAKLVARGARYVAAETGLPEAEARELLLAQGSVRKAIQAWRTRQANSPT